ncbi:MAG: DUF4258 domain-containing protein [Chloroflexi bacterium]|nr:DUF4258 domain-containing protein [Chloroflexota bacterium]
MLLYGKHVLERLIERDILISQVETVLDSSHAELISHSPYTEALVSPSCLVLGWYGYEYPLHVLVAYRLPKVVTAYRPEPPRWVTPSRVLKNHL